MPSDYKPIGKPNPEENSDDPIPKGGSYPKDASGGKMSKAKVNLAKERQNSSYFVTRKA